MKNDFDEWLAKAEEDHIACKALMDIDNPPYTIICFHAQQMAEKYLKGFLTFKNIECRKTHDLVIILQDYCISAEPRTENLTEQVKLLTDYAISTRYPGNIFPPGKNDALEAIESAEIIKDLKLNLLSQ